MADVEEVSAPFGSPDVQWDTYTDDLPEGVIVCGDCRGNNVYAGRVRFENQILIGTVHAEKKVCVFAANGTAHESPDYEILNVPVGEPIGWEKGPDYRERNLLSSGVDKNGVLYVGRVSEDGTTFIGWVDSKEKKLHVVKDGKEKIYTDFEIMIHEYLDRLCICPPAPPGYRSRYD